MNKVCVIILSCGENELDETRAAINAQDYPAFDVHEIENLPNKAAHNTIYKYIENNANRYDLFVKVDGDMVLREKTAISDIVRFFENSTDVDVASFSVLDWLSQRAIIGMHVFSNRCHWEESGEDLFVDPDPLFPGYKRLVWSHPAPIAYHSPTPSVKQAITFGFHRGLKVLQKGRLVPSLSRSQFHYSLLQDVFEQDKVDPERARLAALFGFEMAKKLRVRALDSKKSMIFDEAVLEFCASEETEWRRTLTRRWNGGGLLVGFWFVPAKMRLWVRWLLGKTITRVLNWRSGK